MSHLELEHHVSLEVVSTDTDLLDSLEVEFPDADAPEVASEFSGPQRSDDEDETCLTGHVVFQTTETEGGDVQQYGETHAQNFFDTLTAHDFSSATTYQVRHYESPTGGVTVDAVQEFYEEHPDLQPVDEDGDPYVPSSFNPSNHVVSESSSD